MIGILRKQILREMMFKVAKLEFKSCLISESNILIFKDIFRKREDQIVTVFFRPSGGRQHSLRLSPHIWAHEES